MYIYEALDFFHELDYIKEELELMVEIGLWYLKMWQPAHTLSGWESQRLKLVKHLLKEYRGNTVYFLDEPTVWLHPADIERLLKVLKRFLDKWDTILMIEHDQDILQFADHIIRLDNWKIVN
jgi:excinuclease ABC subunit A